MVSAPARSPIHVFVTGAPASGKTEAVRAFEGNPGVLVVDGYRYVEGHEVRPVCVSVIQPGDLDRARAEHHPIAVVCIVRGEARPIDHPHLADTYVFNDATLDELRTVTGSVITAYVMRHLNGH